MREGREVGVLGDSTSKVCVEEAELTVETQGGQRGGGKARAESWKLRKKASVGCSSVMSDITRGQLRARVC